MVLKGPMEILIVDDSSTIRLKFKAFLNAHGFIVHEAGSGFEGLDLLEKNRDIKLIISDLNMPEMDGMTFIEMVTNNEKTKDVPILVYTTELSRVVKGQAKSLGVKAWIPKPFNQEKILEVIGKILLN